MTPLSDLTRQPSGNPPLAEGRDGPPAITAAVFGTIGPPEADVLPLTVAYPSGPSWQPKQSTLRLLAELLWQIRDREQRAAQAAPTAGGTS